ncbi:GNAT family N-acetyltransferase [Streptomyces sp. Ru73]|uniref:GNAT family N-acetyltransferase n=1 Tax=Streptomyces sp. Ru73 TaxID=2080748 RepID=UPI000CDDF70E|nr:GNAT family N-acetyltransferase [Streptomyces sp. Ru73]POX38149.1 GNAT family N-acetyltransferase [Streptomyces sp. Ru73]
MPQLIAPTTRVQASFLEAMAELRAEGHGAPDDDTGVGREIRRFGAEWDDPAAFARYTGRLRSLTREETARPLGLVPCTTLWYVEGDTFLGRLALRHELNDHLRELGGHIGYYVRPTARRRGHATAMLRAALPLAAGLGIGSALVTCDTTNTASRKVIETCGGIFEDERGGKLRYWVPTRAEHMSDRT